MAYETWEPTYAEEAFDRAQALANALTEQDRAAGIPDAPRFGYSGRRFDEAMEQVRKANKWAQ